MAKVKVFQKLVRLQGKELVTRNTHVQYESPFRKLKRSGMAWRRQCKVMEAQWEHCKLTKICWRSQSRTHVQNPKWRRIQRSTHCCWNSSDLSDNRAFFMNVWQKMLEYQTKCPTENDEKKRNSSDHKGQQLGFMSSHFFCRHSWHFKL